MSFCRMKQQRAVVESQAPISVTLTAVALHVLLRALSWKLPPGVEKSAFLNKPVGGCQYAA